MGAAAVALAEAAVVPLSEISHEVARDERPLAAVSARTAARRAGARAAALGAVGAHYLRQTQTGARWWVREPGQAGYSRSSQAGRVPWRAWAATHAPVAAHIGLEGAPTGQAR